VVQEAYTPTTELDLDAAHIFPKKRAARFFTSIAWKITASSQRTLPRLRKEQVDNAMRAMVQAQQERAVLLHGDLHAGNLPVGSAEQPVEAVALTKVFCSGFGVAWQYRHIPRYSLIKLFRRCVWSEARPR